MPEDVTYHIPTHRGARPVIGHDSAIASIPPDVYVDLGDGPVIHAQRLGHVLRGLSESGAANIGEELHHADWIMTSDPATVERLGMHEPGCIDCRKGVVAALEWLAAHPEGELLVGVLHWAG